MISFYTHIIPSLSLSPSLPFSLSLSHTHTHTHTDFNHLNYQRLGKRLVFLTGCMCGANNKSLGDERIDKQLATESRFTGSFFPMGMARPWW